MARFAKVVRAGLVAFAACSAVAGGPARGQGAGDGERKDPAGDLQRRAQEYRKTMVRPDQAGGAGENPNAAGHVNPTLLRQRNLVGIDRDGDLDLALLSWVVRDPADEVLGATIQPADGSIRAQLGLKEGEGLLVASVAADGPAAKSGLLANDILLALGDKPVAEAADVPRLLKAAGDSPVALKVLRGGKPVTLRVRPVYRVTWGPVVAGETDYYIGVNATPVDETLRAHLDIPRDRGLLAVEVVAGSPAEKAGLKTHDILLDMGGKILDRTEKLVAMVQEARGKATDLKILRAGKEMTLKVTPEPRKADRDAQGESIRLWTLGSQAHPQWYPKVQGAGTDPARGLNFAHQQGWGPVVWGTQAPASPQAPAPASADPAAKRLDDLDKEIKALRKAVEEVRDSLKAGKDR